MAKLTFPPQGEHYERNTKEQYEMLGRFVDAFESMVNEVRELCMQLAARDGRNAVLVQTILSHECMSAKPLFDILRAIIIEALKDAIEAQHDLACGTRDADAPLLGEDGKPLLITPIEYGMFDEVLAFIHRKYQDLASIRNDLLHSTWFVGVPSWDDPDSSRFFINRLKTSRRGLSRAEGLPKTAPELKALVDRCNEVRDWINHLEQCLHGWYKISQVFELTGTKRSGKTWWLIIYPDKRTTLQ